MDALLGTAFDSVAFREEGASELLFCMHCMVFGFVCVWMGEYCMMMDDAWMVRWVGKYLGALFYRLSMMEV